MNITSKENQMLQEIYNYLPNKLSELINMAITHSFF